jgi:hypothetical protein
MKLSDIKTKTQFFEVADIWYQRTNNLRDIAFDNSQPDKRRIKACSLWSIMLARMQKVSSLAIEISKPLVTTFKAGGIVIVGEREHEEFILKNGNIVKL